MADLGNISQVTLPNGDVAHLKDSTARLNNIHVVKGTQTATTASWTGEIDVDALYDGLTIAYYLPRTSASGVTLDLTLSNGETTGAKEVYITGTTRMTTHYTAGSTIYLTYWSAGSILINGTASATDRWVGSDWDNNTVGSYGGSCVAGPNGMARYSLILQVDEGHWESLVLTSSTATTKTKNTSGFLITSPILFQDGATYASGGIAANSACWTTTYNRDSRYSFNVSNSWSANGNPLYLVGQITDGKFYLKDTAWWANELPDNGDAYIYWYVGQMNSAYQFSLHPVHPMFKWVDNSWQPVVAYAETANDASTVNSHTVNSDVPSNAVFTDTTYTFDTGDANGQIKVTPSGGTPQNVSVKGLSAGAYASTYAGSDSAGGPANAVKGAAAAASAYRHVWFSDAGYEDRRNYDDDFKYNPVTNSVKVSGAYMTYNSTTKSIDFTFD